MQVNLPLMPIILLLLMISVPVEPCTIEGGAQGSIIKLAPSGAVDQAGEKLQLHNGDIIAIDSQLIPSTSSVCRNCGNDILTKHDRRLPLELVGAGLLLIPLDKTIVRNIDRTPTGETSDVLTETLNSFGKELLLAYTGALYITGNDYDKESAKLTSAAVLCAWAIASGMKSVIHRERPYLGKDGSMPSNASLGSRDDSFPSGHSASAFAAATVLSHRYPKRKWLYYAVATGVGLARIRKSDHYPSDVLVGAGIGVYCGNTALRNGNSILSIKF